MPKPPPEFVTDMERVVGALERARVYVAGADQSESARNLNERVRQSPLRSELEHAGNLAGRILQWLEQTASNLGQNPDDPSPFGDGGPN